MDFGKFNKMVDVQGLKEDIKKAEENKRDEVPVGKYEVKITKLELTESKQGNPMLSCWFKILAGEYKDQLIFMNQVITQGFQIHICNEFLRSLDTDIDVHFEEFEQYANLIFDIHEKIEAEHLEYVLDYGKKKDFPVFTITECFEGAPCENIPF